MKAIGFGIVLGVLLFFGIPMASEAKNACLCSCFDTDPFFWDLSAGKTSCTDDCTAMCGSGELDGEQILVSNIACIPEKTTDCATGGYAKYKGVNCVLGWVPPEERTGRDWLTVTNGYAPRCDIPITPENANIECQQFGGVAQGGACGPLQNSENQDSYFISRPYLGGMVCGASGCQSAEAEDFTGNYNAAVSDGDKTAPDANDGICYRYGFYYGGQPTYTGYVPNPSNPGYKDPGYTCLARKRNTCGIDPLPNGDSARNYSCQTSVSLPSDATCIAKPSDGWDEDRCGGTMDTWCCEGGTALPQCVFPTDCTGGRTCVGGQCVKNTMCDGLNPNRTCRTPTYTWEITNVCSPNPNLPSQPTLCPREGEYCCDAPTEASESCAGDLAMDAASSAGRQAYGSFECISTDDIGDDQRDSQGRITGISDEGTGSAAMVGEDREVAYNPSTYQNHCLTSNKLLNIGGTTQPRNRCGGVGQLCCNPSKVTTGSVKADQKAIGVGCGTRPDSFTCLDVSIETPDKATLDAFGQTQYEYWTAAATRGICQVTPLPGSSSLYANQECQSGGICCDTSFGAGTACGAPGDAPCPSGFACDAEIRTCVEESYLVSNNLTCAGRALQADDADFFGVQEVIDQNGGEGKFACEFVSTDRSDLGALCIPAGCEGIASPGGLEEYSAQCCVGGTGITASQLAQQQALEGNPVTDVAPWSIRLSPCIKTGNCGLPDILYTGAGFANFLIEISGGVFLAIFVYAGFLYLTAGTSERAAKGKKMIVQAAVAMALLLGAFTFVSFVQQSLIGATAQNDAQNLCTQTPGYSCQILAADPNDKEAMNKEISERSCERNKCPGQENYVCCPQ